MRNPIPQLLILFLIASSASAAVLEGYVMGPGDMGLDDIAVEISSGGEQKAVVYTDLEGYYSITLEPGTYEVGVLGGLQEKTVEISGDRIRADFKVELVNGEGEKKAQTPYLLLAVPAVAVIAYLILRRKKPGQEEEEQEILDDSEEDELTVLRREKKRIEAALGEVEGGYGQGNISREEYDLETRDYRESLEDLREKIGQLEKKLKV